MRYKPPQVSLNSTAQPSAISDTVNSLNICLDFPYWIFTFGFIPAIVVSCAMLYLILNLILVFRLACDGRSVTRTHTLSEERLIESILWNSLCSLVLNTARLIATFDISLVLRSTSLSDSSWGIACKAKLSISTSLPQWSARSAKFIELVKLTMALSVCSLCAHMAFLSFWHSSSTCNNSSACRAFSIAIKDSKAVSIADSKLSG